MEQGVLPGTEEVLVMAKREVDKVHVVRNFIEGRIKRGQVAKLLDLTERQISKLAKRVRERGALGVVHGLRGRSSNHQLDHFVLEQAVCALEDPLWHDFGPTFAQGQLRKCWGLILGVETVRQLMVSTEHWRPGTRKARHRAWRERRPRLGMLTQLDGSIHDWFERRGPKCVLIIFIDDATSRILYGEFVESEDTVNLLRTTKSYLIACGRPIALYVDKDSIYRINRQATVEEELQDDQPASQYGRAMEQLLIELIFAHSPQAKGRVERGFGTHQDRLVKELRLRGIRTIEEANRFLWDVYIPEHNDRCAVDPAHPGDAHRPLLASHDLDAILALHTPRMVQNDYIVQYKRRFYQLQEHQPVRVFPRNRVIVVEGLDGSVRIALKGRFLAAQMLPERPYRPPSHPQVRSRPVTVLPPFFGETRSCSPSPTEHARFNPIRPYRLLAEKQAVLETN